ncbi:superoxide dismutase family protein [Methanocella sp. MCL-LM]|uniref:superoxide dismutase family protein n=1 Tax=Methanocella sp. MCL-LM TaxID=3412035 RepID=UPI003C769E28
MITKLLVLTLLAAAVILTGAYAQGDGAKHAIAVLKNADGEEVGVARFTEDDRGVVLVNVTAEGLPPGYHGIHIHEKGDCTPPFTAAGDHYNPLGKQHGLNNPQGPHAGDLPDLKVNRAGTGRLNVTTDRVTLSPGPTTLFDADGSAIIIHAGSDDQMTDPAGNSGGRIACGVIKRVEATG